MRRSEFSSALRAGRQRMGLSQVALAKKLGVSTASVVRWEKDSEPRSEKERARVLRIVGAEKAEVSGVPVPPEQTNGHDRTLRIGNAKAPISAAIRVSPTLMIEIYADRDEAQKLAEEIIGQL